jgi:hypothetical protein
MGLPTQDLKEPNKSTISRELSRNTGKRGYRHKQANRLAGERQLTMGSARYSLLLRSARVAKPPLCPLPITKSTSQSPMRVNE